MKDLIKNGSILDSWYYGRKVKLPHKVAKELDNAQKTWTSWGIMAAIVNKRPNYGLNHVYKWLYERNGIDHGAEKKDMILNALVNGYEAEESPEDRLKSDLARLISKWLHTERKGTEEEDNLMLAELIIARMEQENNKSG